MWVYDDKSSNNVGAQLLNGNVMPVIEISNNAAASVTDGKRIIKI